LVIVKVPPEILDRQLAVARLPREGRYRLLARPRLPGEAETSYRSRFAAGYPKGNNIEFVPVVCYIVAQKRG